MNFKIRNVVYLPYNMGLNVGSEYIEISVARKCNKLKLLVFERNVEKEVYTFNFDKNKCLGDIWFLSLYIDDVKELENMEYAFEDENGRFADPYGKSFSGRDTWGKAAHYKNIRRSPFITTCFDWGEGGDRLYIPWSESIVYRLHIRGFTKSASSKTIHSGTFSGVVEKIPYIKSLGITTLDIMPCQEFEELMPLNIRHDIFSGMGYNADILNTTKKVVNDEKTVKNHMINYWGYADTLHFAPKASFSMKKHRNPPNEFKHMVKSLHNAGIEVIAEFYFKEGIGYSYVRDVLIYWAYEYRLDGFHILGNVYAAELAKEAALSGIKLIYENWDNTYRGYYNFKDGSDDGRLKRLASFNDSFQNDMRRFLKGDEGMINSLVYHTKNNPQYAAQLNYIADIKGFSLVDMLSYDIKHNEANLENNKDGTDYNYSWNCGCEGSTSKKTVNRLRAKQLRNASLLVFLSQGTPVIAQGDELGQSKGGNNNTYCQDNRISWLNWKLINSNSHILEWFQFIINFRKKHRVFHACKEPANLDNAALGMPDVSYHGVKAWQPDFDNYSRQLGILYFGQYAKNADGSFDDTFYVMYNMHWEAHDFALPKPEKGYRWHLCIDTDRHDINGFYQEGSEKDIGNQRGYRVKARSIVVLKGVKI